MRIYRLSAALLALVLGACAMLASDPMQQAREEFARQDYFAAQEHVLAALQEDRSDVQALELLARIQLAMGLGEDALRTLERLDRAGDASAATALISAEAWLQIGDLAQARDALEGLDGAEAWRLRALAASLEGDDAAARTAFRAGHTAAGDPRKLFTAEASFYLNRGDADGARFAVGRAQQLAPDSVETLFVSARLAELDARPEMATRAWLAILDRAPTDRPALLGAIRQSQAIDRYDIARPLVLRGRAAYPHDVDFLYHAANLLVHDGHWSGARDLLQQYETQLAGHDDARALYGRVLLELGQLEHARRLLATLNRRQPGHAGYARIYARILLAQGEYALARQVMQPIVARADAQPVDRELAELAAQG